MAGMHPNHPLNQTHDQSHGNGGIWRTQQAHARAKAQAVQGPNGPWAGYGMPSPAQGQQGNIQALQGCIQAFSDMLGSQLQNTDLAPWIHVPYRGRRLCEHRLVVLSVAAAVDPVTNAAGIALAAALNSVVPGTAALLEMPTATAWVDLFTFAVERSSEAYFESWGISQANHVNEALEVGLQGGTAGGLPTPPSPYLSSHEVYQHEPANFMTAENQGLTVKIRLLDTTTPLVVNFGVCFWTYPVTNRRDNRDRNATNLRTGFGPDCDPL
jgi:hypothetical protein